MQRPYDAVVVGSGPAGSVASLLLARGGARVAMVDKAAFPRDKACGDLIGPRAVALLSDLGLDPPAHGLVGDMVVLGPTGGRTWLRARPGRTYPGAGWSAPRAAFDAWLRDAALAAGTEAHGGRVTGVETDGAERAVVHRDEGAPLPATVVIGADGATSTVAESAGLVDPARVLWGFAVRVYLSQEVRVPIVAFWDTQPGHGFPGYGWLFPGPDGRANAGLGVGVGTDRRQGAVATRSLTSFLDHLHRLGEVDGCPGSRLGGWMKMGLVGTVPARGRVLLVGDAAGLVNPLQGEGITQALDTGAAAARAVLAGPAGAAAAYRAHLRAHHAAYQGQAAAIHRAAVGRPRLVSALGRALTTRPAGRALGQGWALYWNDLVDGASPGAGRLVATMADRLARAATAGGRTRHWIDRALAD